MVTVDVLWFVLYFNCFPCVLWTVHYLSLSNINIIKAFNNNNTHIKLGRTWHIRILTHILWFHWSKIQYNNTNLQCVCICKGLDFHIDSIDKRSRFTLIWHKSCDYEVFKRKIKRISIARFKAAAILQFNI